MGVRFRKSINLGGGFRINFSKSGIGYSWGVKGLRMTKTAKGRSRTTVSIPGTGLSYVHESGKKKSKKVNRSGNSARHSAAQVIENNHYDTQAIVNTDASKMVSEGLEDMLASASKALKLNKYFTIGSCVALFFSFAVPYLFLLAIALLALNIFVMVKGTIELDYNIDADQQTIVDERMRPMYKMTESKKVWRIMQTSKVIDRKYSSGAKETVERKVCTASTKANFPFKTNIKVASFRVGNETLLFLPDKLFIIQGSKIGALNYSDITSDIHTTHFIESNNVPKDAQVIGHTWKYVNKSGAPDKRFKDNRQLPICLYGEYVLRSASGLNTVIMFSNPNINSNS